MNRTIEAILKLSAKLGNTAAFGQLAGKMAMVDKQAKAYNRTQGMMARGANAAYLAMGRVIAPAALAYGAVATTKAFATVERRMERIGITADASAAETTAALEMIRASAQDIGAPVDSLMEGMESLVASGKSMGEAMAFLPSVAKTAHAADAAFGDIATTADAVGNSFGIAAGDMDRAFDILAKGGKLGKFELKDMAAELPSLAPAFAALGYTGEAGLKKLTAALQTVRLETGQSGEAATAFMDVLTKMESTATAANFKRFGIDIRKEMAKARKEGKDTIDAFIDLSAKAVKGDMAKLPQLFTDKQMLTGMRALMRHTGEMTGYFDALGNSVGTVDADIKRLNDNAASGFERISNSWDRLTQSMGEALVAHGAIDAINAVSAGFDAAAESGKFRKAYDSEYEKQYGGKGLTWLSKDQKRGLAWRGGYRSPDDRRAIDGYGAYGAGRSAAPDNAAGTFPIPSARPELRTKDDEFIAPRMVAGSGMTARETAAAARRGAMDQAGFSSNEAEKVAQALANGGDKAGQAVQAGVSGGGDQAAQALQAAILSAGRTIAAEIGAAVAGGAAQIRAAGAQIRANVGRSGPQIEGAP